MCKQSTLGFRHLSASFPVCRSFPLACRLGMDVVFWRAFDKPKPWRSIVMATAGSAVDVEARSKQLRVEMYWRCSSPPHPTPRLVRWSVDLRLWVGLTSTAWVIKTRERSRRNLLMLFCIRIRLMWLINIMAQPSSCATGFLSSCLLYA